MIADGAPRNQPLQLATAADAGYLPYLACFMSSLGRSRQSRPIALTVLQRGIGSEDRAKLAALLPPSASVQWITPDRELVAAVGAPLALAHRSPHYFRLLIPFLLPAASRAIYLDADTLVIADLSELWDTDLAEQPVAASRDYLGCMQDAVSNWEALKLDPGTPYLNSGVLVMDLDRWRAESLSEGVVDVCGRNEQYLRAQGKWPQHDQYGINVVLRGRWTELEPSWNHGAFLPPGGERIVHFIGDAKVDAGQCQEAFRRLFFACLEGTPYSMRKM
jgi:lipopolysaccharide biosynthesis glycosyltransferase